MLLITGTQRTGTSLLAEFVKRCGYPLEGDNDSVGAHDDANISLEYRRILNDPTFPWSNYPIVKPADQVPRLADLDYEVAKFPFLMMHPRLMQIWLDERGTRDQLLILVREMEKVVNSKSNTPERSEIFSTDSILLKLTPERLKQNWFDSFMLVLNSGIDYRILKFPEYVEDYDSIYFALHDFGYLENVHRYHEEIWLEILDRNKITAE